MSERYACFLDLTFDRDWQLARRAPAFTSYNIGADTEVPIVRHDVEGRREAVMARWGLVPAAAHGQRRRAPRIHVAASGLTSGTVADVWQRSRRCIFPMQGFYLWQRRRAEAAIPWFVSLARQKTFGVAGLWDASDDLTRNLHFLSAAMVTLPLRRLTPELDRPGNRVPAILAIEAYDTWLGADAAAAAALLHPLPPGELRAWRVGPQVCDLNNKGPACMEPLATG